MGRVMGPMTRRRDVGVRGDLIAQRATQPGERWLLVCTTGGHLEEMLRLSNQLVTPGDWVGWATQDNAQSRSLLAGRAVWHFPDIRPRGVVNAAAQVPRAIRLLRRERITRVVSTGSAIAVPFFVAAETLGIRHDYIESAARADGPSMTGRVVARLPRTQLATQSRAWADGRWVYRGSVFDGYRVEAVQPPAIHRVVVTVGTTRSYGFDRLVERLPTALEQVLASDGDVLWQIGATKEPPAGLPGRVLRHLPASALLREIVRADLVISHAGVGSALAILDAGRRPVLAPRLARYGEHVDDHQELIAADLDDRGLAVRCDAGHVTAADLLRAASARVVRGPAGHSLQTGSEPA